jgi:arylsulfatase
MAAAGAVSAGTGGSGGSIASTGGGAGGDDGATDGGMPPLGPPNIIVIMADDLGFSDLGSYGGEVQTPHIDSLAGDGLRLTNFYNGSRCSPTRASMLTGQYPHKVNLAANGRSMGRNGATIAELLGANGYNTAMAGKWHLSEDLDYGGQAQLEWLNHQARAGEAFSTDVTSYPVGRGFQHHYGPIWGVVNFFDPFSLVDGTQTIDSVPDGFYMTNAIGQKAVEYVNSFATEDKPFFLYVASTTVLGSINSRARSATRRSSYRARSRCS